MNPKFSWARDAHYGRTHAELTLILKARDHFIEKYGPGVTPPVEQIEAYLRDAR